MPWAKHMMPFDSSEPPVLSLFYVSIVDSKTGHARSSFEAMSSSHLAAVKQFGGLCQRGEVIEVMDFADREQEQRYLAADRARDLNRVEWSDRRALSRQMDLNRRNPNPLFQGAQL